MSNIYLPAVPPVIYRDDENKIKRVHYTWSPVEYGILASDVVFTPIFYDRINDGIGNMLPFVPSRAAVIKRGGWGTFSLDLYCNTYTVPISHVGVASALNVAYTSGSSFMGIAYGELIHPEVFGRIILGAADPVPGDIIRFALFA